MAELSVDKLWNAFHNSSLLSADFTENFDSEGVVVIDATSSMQFCRLFTFLIGCISDVRLELRDERYDVYHAYLINEITEQRQAFLQRGCGTEDLCVSTSPCGPYETCTTEWRGYRCE